MAVAIPAIVGSALGTGIGAALGATGIGLTVASSIGALAVSSLANGTNPFDDPAGALASIAMGTMFSKAAQGIFAGQNVTVDGVQAPELVQGASAATSLSGNIYSDALSSSIDNGLSVMTEMGYESFGESITEIADASEFGTINLVEDLSDQAFIKTINKSMAVSGSEPFTFDLGLDTMTDAKLTNPSLGGILTDDSPMVTNELAETFFSPTSTELDGTAEFGLDRQRLERYQSMRNLTGKPIEGEGPEDKKDKMKNPFGSGSPLGSSFKMPQVPQAVQTLMGNVSAGSGTGGQGGFGDTQNKVVGPMIRSYQRQQERIANIANQTWGMQSTSRFSGLFS